MKKENYLHISVILLTITILVFLSGCTDLFEDNDDTVNPAATPTFNPPGGKYTSNPSVIISCMTAGARIFYTIDGSDPSNSSTRQSDASPIGPITVTVNPMMTIRAIAEAKGYFHSTEGNATYTDLFVIGDTGPAGGIVFYDKGGYSDGWRYLEAAPNDYSTRVQWYNGSYVTTGATATSIGAGTTNTDTIVSIQGSGTYAAFVCADFSLGGFNDWFLPSKEELNKMYERKDVIGGFTSGYYWSSSEFLDSYAWFQSFDDGFQNIKYGKEIYRCVRALRAF